MTEILVFIVSIGAIVMLFFGIVLEGHRRREVEIERKFERLGNITSGQITERYIRRTNAYYLVYSYQYEGQVFQCKQRVVSQDFDIWSEGTTVAVRYLRSNPQTARLEDISPAFSLRRLRFQVVLCFISVSVYITIGIWFLLGLPGLRRN